MRRESRRADARALRYFDNGDLTQHGARIAALVARVAPTRNESFRLIEMKGGHGDAGASRDLADGQFAEIPAALP
jgi:hypothetical protein